MSDQLRSELAPSGTLRAAINMSNNLLVNGIGPSGDPEGVAPDMARLIAERLGVPVVYVPFPKPGLLADAAESDVWDIGLIGAEPKRAEKIAFTAAYAEIESTYLVPEGSPLHTIDAVDAPGIRIAVAARTAYDLWLERNIRHAELVQCNGGDETFKRFQDDKLDALAGLRPRLINDVLKMPGSRILDGNFTTVQQAIGTLRRHAVAPAFLAEFVEEAKRSGVVAQLIARHGIQGLSVAGAARPA